ncbi:unnamed protein product [Nesidiocoris tenuis]|uniref:Uncharacterized protein n=1 Tax=Nesidiocoris tenuis TaxID=355587 RepID=A0A6H5HIK6_9HEMI|nr:unnamed protein product [Nesidiocoris tenuis]
MFLSTQLGDELSWVQLQYLTCPPKQTKQSHSQDFRLSAAVPAPFRFSILGGSQYFHLLCGYEEGEETSKVSMFNQSLPKFGFASSASKWRRSRRRRAAGGGTAVAVECGMAEEERETRGLKRRNEEYDGEDAMEGAVWRRRRGMSLGIGFGEGGRGRGHGAWRGERGFRRAMGWTWTGEPLPLLCRLVTDPPRRAVRPHPSTASWVFAY